MKDGLEFWPKVWKWMSAYMKLLLLSCGLALRTTMLTPAGVDELDIGEAKSSKLRVKLNNVPTKGEFVDVLRGIGDY